MAIVITTAGRFRPVFVNGVDAINEMIGGDTFDIIRFAGDADMFVDDSGLLKNRPVNLIATAIGVESGKTSVVVGDVLILGHDGFGESIDCPKWVAEMLTQMKSDLGDDFGTETTDKKGEDETA